MPIMDIPFNSVHRQYNSIRQEILEATDHVLRSGKVMSGQWTERFERWLHDRNDQQYVVTCHSGTQALEIIAEYYRGLSVSNTPTVLIPGLTFPATANAFVRAGWEIEFIDTDAYGQLNLDNVVRDEHVFQAICAVGLYGQALKDTLRYYTDWVIEDGAQHWLSDECRRIGRATAISFDPTKNLNSYGNGGAVITPDRQLALFARDWTMHGKKNNHNEVGSNSRMSEVDCAQLMVKTRYIDTWQARRRDIARHWMQALKEAPVRCLIDDSNFATHCVHKFVIDVDDRDALAQHLKEAGIETRVHYSQPLWELPAFQGRYDANKFLGQASSLSRRCLSLPIYPELTDSEVEYVASQVLAHVSSTHN